VTFGDRRAYAGSTRELNLWAPTGRLVGALVVDPRRADRHGARPDRQLALTAPPVADDEPLAVPIDLLVERRDVLVDLRLERRDDHPTSALPRKIIQRDPGLNILPDGKPANILHGVPSCRPSPASVFSNREGTPPSFSTPSTTSGYISFVARPRRDA